MMATMIYILAAAAAVALEEESTILVATGSRERDNKVDRPKRRIDDGPPSEIYVKQRRVSRKYDTEDFTPREENDDSEVKQDSTTHRLDDRPPVDTTAASIQANDRNKEAKLIEVYYQEKLAQGYALAHSQSTEHSQIQSPPEPTLASERHNDFAGKGQHKDQDLKNNISAE
jgi:hypothetical protein